MLNQHYTCFCVCQLVFWCFLKVFLSPTILNLQKACHSAAKLLWSMDFGKIDRFVDSCFQHLACQLHKNKKNTCPTTASWCSQHQPPQPKRSKKKSTGWFTPIADYWYYWPWDYFMLLCHISIIKSLRLEKHQEWNKSAHINTTPDIASIQTWKNKEI